MSLNEFCDHSVNKTSHETLIVSHVQFDSPLDTRTHVQREAAFFVLL